MTAYSMDLRKRVLADCDAGLKTKQVAEKYDVSRTWVRWLKRRRRLTGIIQAGVPTGRPRKIDRERLTTLVKEKPDATLAELRDRLGVKCSLSAIWMALDAAGITFKKSLCGPPSSSVPMSPSAARSGASRSSGSTRKSSSSSTKPGPRRT